MRGTPEDKAMERAESLMRSIDAQIGRTSIEKSRFMRDRYVAVLGALIGEIEIAMNSAKEIDYEG